MNTTASAASLGNIEVTEEVTLGWHAMPAYGEVMTELFGVKQAAFEAPGSSLSQMLTSFWGTVLGGATVAA